MRKVASLWIGDRLGDLELASINSFLRLGHSVTVYSYKRIPNIPPDAIAADAAEILPAKEILRYRRSKSPAIHANIFRYVMLQKTDLLWVDLDMIAIKAFEFPSEWVFGREDENQINNAVLGLPKNSGTLAALSRFTLETRGVPPQLTGLRRVKYQLRSWMVGGLPIVDWPWGSTGPRALTMFSREAGEHGHALPPSAFYWVPIDDVARFLRPGALRRSDLPADCYGVHLWGSRLRKVLHAEFAGRVPPDSFLDLAIRGDL